MSTKHYCDGCEVELSPDNRFPRSEPIRYEFDKTKTIFSFAIGYGSNANNKGQATVHGDGDICRPCAELALQSYIDEKEQFRNDNIVDEAEEWEEKPEADNDDGEE